jgi:hypothetical protein
MQRIHGIAIGWQADRVACHGLHQTDFGAILPMRQEMHRIPPGKNAKQAAFRVCHQHGANASAMHGRAGFLHGRIWPHGQGVLVADHFTHAAFLHGFLLSSLRKLMENALPFLDPTQV